MKPTSTLILRVVIALCGVAPLSAAHGAPAPQCVDGEYVLTVTANRSLQKKALEDIRAASTQSFEIAETAKETILVSQKQTTFGAKRLSTKLYDLKNDVCMKLRSNERATITKRKKNPHLLPPRRYRCSCNSVMYATYDPNDTYYYLQWALNQSNDVDMNLPEAWNITRGSKMVTVAVIDSGVDRTHPDLATNMDWVNWGEGQSANGADDDGNGYVDDIYGFNAIDNSGNANDDNGHGTHVAGTIGAAVNNYQGVCGLNQGIRILPVKFLNSAGQGSLFNAAKAIDYVTDMSRRAKASGWEQQIVASNNSWGGGAAYGPALYDAIARAKAAGVLFIAAAGNESNNNDATPSYPSNYAVDNIISVAAIDRNGSFASFSNYGANSVHVAAPGVDIASTYPGGRYVYMSGTSMAAPHVTGAVALLKAYSKDLTYSQIRNIVFSTVKPLPSLSGRVLTGGLVDVYAMLRAAPANALQWDWSAGHQYPSPGAPTPTPTPTPIPATPTPSPTATPLPSLVFISGQVTGIGNRTGVKVVLSKGTTTIEQYAGTSGSFSFERIPAGTYTITANARGLTFPTNTIVANATLSGITLAATARSAPLSVYVISPDMKPVPGIPLSLNGTAVTTDSRGRATTTAQFGSDYTITTAPAGYSVDQPIVTGTLYGATTRVIVVRRM